MTANKSKSSYSTSDDKRNTRQAMSSSTNEHRLSASSAPSSETSQSLQRLADDRLRHFTLR